jgi:hypothetical protein
VILRDPNTDPGLPVAPLIHHKEWINIVIMIYALPPQNHIKDSSPDFNTDHQFSLYYLGYLESISIPIPIPIPAPTPTLNYIL